MLGGADPAMLVLAAWPGAPHLRLEPPSRFDRKLTDQLGEAPAALAGAAISEIDTVGFERILRITLVPRGGTTLRPLELFFELVLRTPFIVLTMGGDIITAVRATGTHRPDDRRMERGGAYLLPFALGRPDAIPRAEAALSALLAPSRPSDEARDQPTTWTKILARTWRGMPEERLTSLLGDASDPRAAAARLAGFRGPLAIDHDDRGWPLLVPSTGGIGAAGDSPLAVTAEWARRRLEHERALRLHAAIAQALRTERKRLARARSAIERDAHKRGDAAHLRRRGETLLAHLPKVRRGVGRVELPDPYDGTLIEIELDPRQAPASNAEAYFQAARRAERAAAHVEARRIDIEERERALAGAEMRLAEMGDRSTVADLGNLARELAAAGIGRGDLVQAISVSTGGELGQSPGPAGIKAAERRKKAQERLPYRVYPVGGGWEVWVGRSRADNDLLTHKLARPHDLWLHAQGAAGSHVLLRRRDGTRGVPPRQVIEAAASHAAFFSRARSSRLVPVIATEKRYVRKPRGSPPGVAATLREKTLMAVPRPPITDPEKPSPNGQ